MRVVDGYVVLASGADRGTLGCGLWAGAERPYASVDGKDFFFRQTDFVAVYASPRVLVVRVTARRLQCTVVVAHAPHSGVDVALRDAWWQDLSCRLAGQPDLVLLVDANARLGSSVSASVGAGGLCQREDSSGAFFHRSLVELGLCVPATFGPLDTTAFTWVANGGATHRIDYVAVPVAWDLCARECNSHCVAPRESRAHAGDSAVHVVDSAGDWEDHFLVELRVPLAIRWAPRGTQWKVDGVDRASLRDPDCCSRFKLALRAIRPPPWCMSVDEHERSTASAVCKAAKVAFGAPTKHPRREYIDERAWGLICDRRTVKTWCRERRVSAATRGISPGRVPDPLWVFMWASGRAGPTALASSVFSELAACVAPLVSSGCQGQLWESLRVFMRHSGGVLKGHLRAACDSFLESTARELAAAQADRAYDLAWRRAQAPLSLQPGRCQVEGRQSAPR